MINQMVFGRYGCWTQVENGRNKLAESDDRPLLFWAFDKKSLSIIEIQLVFYHSTHTLCEWTDLSFSTVCFKLQQVNLPRRASDTVERIEFSKFKTFPAVLTSFLPWVFFFPPLHMRNGFKWAAVVFRRNPRNVKPQRGNVSLSQSETYPLSYPHQRERIMKTVCEGSDKVGFIWGRLTRIASHTVITSDAQSTFRFVQSFKLWV